MNAIMYFYTNPEKTIEIGENAKKMVLSSFEIKSVLEKYEKLHASLLI